jgi:hypothetical protein
VHLDTIEYFIYTTDAQLECSKIVKIYMRYAPTCFGFSQPPSGSYYMCFAKVISVNNQLKHSGYTICSVWWLHIYPVFIGVCVCGALCRVRLTYRVSLCTVHYTHTHAHTPVRTE